MIPCTACGQQLYPLERMTLNSRVFHKTGCARCSTCNTNLTINNFAMSGDKLYCKTHYLSNFAKSGGRYSFPNEEDQSKSKRVCAAPATEPRPRSEVPKPILQATPTKPLQAQSYRVSAPPASAPPAPSNRLNAFLTGAESSPSASLSSAQTKTATIPAPLYSVQSKAESTPVKSVQSRIQQATSPVSSTPISKTSTQVTGSENKLAAFLSKGELPKPVALYSSRDTADSIRREELDQKEDQPMSKSARPLSLKERIAIYSMEATNPNKNAESIKSSAPPPPLPSKENNSNIPKVNNLPPLPRKESVYGIKPENRPVLPEHKPFVSYVASTNGHQSATSMAKVAAVRSPAQGQGVSESKLAGFLRATENASGNARGSPEVMSSQIPDSSQTQTAHLTSPSAPTMPTLEEKRQSVSIKERIATYSSEANKGNPDKRKAPELPPGKPRLSTSPVKKDSRQTINQSKVSTASPRNVTSDKSESRPLSIRERIASYQSRASGRKSNPSLERDRESSKPSSPSSPISKRTGFKSRFPSFLKHQVHANSSQKNVDFMKGLRKVCDEGTAQVTKVSTKNFQDSHPELKAVAVDLLEAFEKARKRLASYDEERKRVNVG